MKYILASGSPRRKELLKELISNFEIIPAIGDEVYSKELSPSQIVKMLASNKAEEVFLAHKENEVLVVGADTIVVYKNEILGKPCSIKDAETMLKTLSGKEHKVLTGVCVILMTKDGKIKKLVDVEETIVAFREMTKEEIEDYIKSGAPMDKAGGYGIQDGDFAFVKKGSYSNVVGLPLELVKKMLDNLSITK